VIHLIFDHFHREYKRGSSLTPNIASDVQKCSNLLASNIMHSLNLFRLKNCKTPTMRSVFTTALVFLFVFSIQAQTSKSSVALTSFNAAPREKQVLLTWNPEPIGVTNYQLERSTNGSNFVLFGSVQGVDMDMEFVETDFTPLPGLSYYRLKLISSDGTIGYSNVVPVKFGENGLPMSATSNQVNGNTTETIKDKSILVVVRSAAGDEFYSKVEVDGNDPLIFRDGDPSLAQGTYTIVACSNQDLCTKQFEVK
jgi:hypothetical protein